MYNSSEKVLRVLAGIGDNLKTARFRRQLTLQEAAEKIGTSKSSVLRMEKGDISVKIGVFISAAGI
jgi:cytoskeletal protein RodZ